MTPHSQPRGGAGSRHTARRIAWTAFGLAAASLACINAQAGDDPYAPPQKTVDYADLDLSVPAQANILYTRLQRAAQRVCSPADARDLRKGSRQRECYGESLAAAVAAVNHNAVTALYRSDKSIKLAAR